MAELSERGVDHAANAVLGRDVRLDPDAGVSSSQLFRRFLCSSMRIVHRLVRVTSLTPCRHHRLALWLLLCNGNKIAV